MIPSLSHVSALVAAALPRAMSEGVALAHCATSYRLLNRASTFKRRAILGSLSPETLLGSKAVE